MRAKGCLDIRRGGGSWESVITGKGLRAKLLSRRGGVISDDACALQSHQFKYGPCGTLHVPNFNFPFLAVHLSRISSNIKEIVGIFCAKLKLSLVNIRKSKWKRFFLVVNFFLNEIKLEIKILRSRFREGERFELDKRKIVLFRSFRSLYLYYIKIICKYREIF